MSPFSQQNTTTRLYKLVRSNKRDISVKLMFVYFFMWQMSFWFWFFIVNGKIPFCQLKGSIDVYLLFAYSNYVIYSFLLFSIKVIAVNCCSSMARWKPRPFLEWKEKTFTETIDINSGLKYESAERNGKARQTVV